MGADNFHPRAWSHLSEQSAETMTQYLALIEKSLHWPDHSQWLLYFLISSLAEAIGPLVSLLR